MKIRATVAPFLIGSLISIGSAAVSSAADPFYNRLIESGILAFAQGDYESAAGDLRLACFGLLEEPVKLAEGLTYLALAEAEIGDEPTFSKTFGRLLEVERRFQGFSQLDLSSQVRESLEAHLERWIPIEALEREATFAGVVRRKREAQILEMPPDERLLELERRVASDPGDPTWRLWLAELAFSTGDYPVAFEAASEMLSRDPGQAHALCLRGRAGAALGSCDQAILDLTSCESSEQGSAVIEERVRCSIQLAAWDEADALLGQLSVGELRASPFKQLARDVRRGKKASARQRTAAPQVPDDALPDGVLPDGIPEDPPTEGEETADPSIDAASVAATAEPSPESGSEEAMPQETPAADSAESIATSAPAVIQPVLGRIREQLQQATTRGELEETFAQARQIADDHPQNNEAQLVTAEVAYRMARWQDATTYFGRVTDLGTVAPDRQFYYAVALYEAGDSATSREILQRCLPSLESTDFVESYAAKILNGG